MKIAAFRALLILLAGLMPYCHAESNSQVDASSLRNVVHGIDLSPFTLQLPTGSPGKPDKVTGSQLNSYGSLYFHSGKGKITLYAPFSGVTTAHSKFARTELAQTARWKFSSGVHTLSVRLSVDQAPPSGVAIGQLHEKALNGSKPRPPVMLIWNQGSVVASVLQADTLNARRQKFIIATNVPLGQPFDYAIKVFSDGRLQISAAGKREAVQLDPSFATRDLYFKVGAYLQDSASAGPGGATVSIYRLNMTQQKKAGSV